MKTSQKGGGPKKSNLHLDLSALTIKDNIRAKIVSSRNMERKTVAAIKQPYLGQQNSGPHELSSGGMSRSMIGENYPK